MDNDNTEELAARIFHEGERIAVRYDKEGTGNVEPDGTK